MTASDAGQARRVLAFWFDGPDGAARGRVRKEWFAKDPAFDAQIRESFGALIEGAFAGDCDAWGFEPATAPALVVLLDQFPRNAFRDTPRMYAGDAAALAAARRIVAEGWDRGLDALLRQFCYLPFEHSEALADQREGLRLFGQLRDDPRTAGAWEWAQRHHDVIARFGRFPHRNAILGRASSAEELEFLRQPGSAF